VGTRLSILRPVALAIDIDILLFFNNARPWNLQRSGLAGAQSHALHLLCYSGTTEAALLASSKAKASGWSSSSVPQHRSEDVSFLCEWTSSEEENVDEMTVITRNVRTEAARSSASHVEDMQRRFLYRGHELLA
jgi:hypothetical protein